ncbi:MAG: type II toxin-antitoxin system RelE/ParE family toxin [Bdellovibrio sp.]|nr:type II toxin-antitoxin system RelE/ParE family toxin [Bdellovibrio sp.]
MKLLWSLRALNDLMQIGSFIAVGSPENARRHVQHLVDRAKQAAKFPQSGRLVPEYQEKNLRELIEENYRIVYEINSNQMVVKVIAVFEGHRLLK